MSSSDKPKRRGQNPTRRAARHTKVSDPLSRFAANQRYSQILAGLVNDQGGADQVPEGRLHLIRRFASCALLAEQMEATFMHDDDINIKDYALVCTMLVQIGRSIGIDRISHSTAPTLADLLRSE